MSIRRLGQRGTRCACRRAGIPAEALIAEALGGLRDIPEGEETLALRRDLPRAAATTIRTGGRPEDALWTLWAGTDWPATLRQEALSGGDSAPRAHRDLDAVTALFTLARESLAPVGDEGVRWFLAEIAQQQIPADSQREAAVFGRGVRPYRAPCQRARVAVHHRRGVQEGIWPDIQRQGSGIRSPQADLCRAGGRRLHTRVGRHRAQALPPGVFARPAPSAGHRRGGDRRRRRPTFTVLVGTGASSPHRRRLENRACTRCEHSWPTCDGQRRMTPHHPPLRQAATRRLAALAQQRDDSGTPLVPDADPRRWWGLAEPTSWAAPTRL